VAFGGIKKSHGSALEEFYDGGMNLQEISSRRLLYFAGCLQTPPSSFCLLIETSGSPRMLWEVFERLEICGAHYFQVVS
jgi:hypothetical protein